MTSWSPVGSTLASSLADALPRLCAPGAELSKELLDLIRALADALEAGALELDFSGAAPEGLDPALWPEAYRQAAARSELASGPEAPLVLSGERLRWRRWHQQLEHTLAALVQRAREPLPQAPSAAAVAAARQRAAHADQAQAEAATRQRAGRAGLDASQQQAVAAALHHRVLLLSGGPGTGKTSTVVQLLVAVLTRHPGLRLQLAAPTGKAAARLREAIERGCSALAPELAEPMLAAPCSTLHRLLESSGERFGRNARHPLALDLLVVDELSMVDLPLMAALLAALPAHSRLVLVGDPAQLPPVGPGPVLQELMRTEWLQQLGPAAVELRTSYRNAGAIAAVAAQLRRAPAQPLPAIRQQLEALTPRDNLIWRQAPPQAPPADAIQALREHQQQLAALAAALPLPSDGALEPGAATALLAELERCVLLTPVRQGRWGVESIHRQLLGEAAGRSLAHWPLGTPVLNQRNLSEQGLANGDVGVLVDSGEARRVLFPGGRLLHPARLGQVEPALALTVHKSQGSQYGEVLLLLPAGRQLDTRLLYTGLTRARRSARLYTAHRPA